MNPGERRLNVDFRPWGITGGIVKGARLDNNLVGYNVAGHSHASAAGRAKMPMDGLARGSYYVECAQLALDANRILAEDHSCTKC